MRSTITYRRPAPVNKQAWGGKPGIPYGNPGKKQPRPAPQEQAPPAIGLPSLNALLRK